MPKKTDESVGMGMLPEDWEITVIRSRRKTVAISVKGRNEVLVKAPERVPGREIRSILEEKRGWIEKQMEKLALVEEECARAGYLSAAEIRELADRALKILPGRVELFAAQLGVAYQRITIRNQKTCWGSCSGKGNLNFNCLLMLAPPEVADYVVVHELCHRLEMNHSQRFWRLVESVLPDYRERRRWLKVNGPALMRRMWGDRA